MKGEIGLNSEETDQALAEMYLTSRSAKRGMTVPRGPVTITISSQLTKEEHTYELDWEYTPERINYDSMESRKMASVSPGGPTDLASHFKGMQMIYADWDLFRAQSKIDNPYVLGGRTSYVPPLGPKIWESDQTDIFNAYVYLSPDRKVVGYVRIPSYVPENPDAAVLEFASLVNRFEKTCDALVIDQLNNPGGSVFYLYALVSMLSDQAMVTPKHRMTITQAEVFEATQNLPILELVQNDFQAQWLFGPTISGYPVSYQFVRYVIDFYRFIIDEWNAGRRLTNPYYLFGVNRINPSLNRFTKPILLLTNNLDFSGGDFFPAILQDNKRALILGSRTAGAGGYVNRLEYPNALGVELFTLTGSIAERVDLNPIENLGVTPDIEYKPISIDYKTNYLAYQMLINLGVEALVTPPSIPPPPASKTSPDSNTIVTPRKR